MIDIDSLLASEPEYTSSIATHRGGNRLAYGNMMSMNASRTTMLPPSSRSFVPSSQRNFYPPQQQQYQHQQFHHTNEDDYQESDNQNQGGSDYEQPYVAAEDNDDGNDEDNKLTNQPTNSTADTTNDVYDKSQEKEMNTTTNTQSSALEVDRPKLSLTKANRKLKSSIPAISTTISNTVTTSGGMWGYKPELSGAVAAANNNTIEAFANDVDNSMLPSESISTSTAKIDPKSWLLYRKDESNKELSNVKNELVEDTATTTNNVEGVVGVDEEYVNIFWLDACENNGLIYLFGKLPVNDDEDGLKRYVSCCVVIHGSDRNLFVLPKKVGTGDTYKEDGQISRMSMGSVHQELSSILVPSIIPRCEGQSFRCKSVRRKYAFEYGEIPREETEYLKVVYSAKHNIPTLTQCQGGKTYERIFGAGSSILELFLLKRKLMGPCWITIRKPKANPSIVSWCKVEIAVDNPKNIMKTPTSECGLTPVLTSISISMKTAVNPSTHLHEIIMLSGIYYIYTVSLDINTIYIFGSL